MLIEGSFEKKNGKYKKKCLCPRCKKRKTPNYFYTDSVAQIYSDECKDRIAKEKAKKKSKTKKIKQKIEEKSYKVDRRKKYYILTCIDCGKEFEHHSKLTKRCKSCKDEHNKETTNQWRKDREDSAIDGLIYHPDGSVESVYAKGHSVPKEIREGNEDYFKKLDKSLQKMSFAEVYALWKLFKSRKRDNYYDYKYGRIDNKKYFDYEQFYETCRKMCGVYLRFWYERVFDIEDYLMYGMTKEEKLELYGEEP